MSITAERKAALIKEYATKDGDTGSPEVQVAILTERITNLTEHFKSHTQGQPFPARPAEAGLPPPFAPRLPAQEPGRGPLLERSSSASASAADDDPHGSDAGRIRHRSARGASPLPAPRAPPYQADRPSRSGGHVMTIGPPIRKAPVGHGAGSQGAPPAGASLSPSCPWPRPSNRATRKGRHDPCSTSRREEIDLERAQARPRDGQDRPPGRRRRAGHLWRDHGARHRRLHQGAEARHRLLPAHRELPGEVPSPRAASPAASSSARAVRPSARR
jgi:hypothetical protein